MDLRYYRIDIAGKTAFTSHPNGVLSPPDPGALLVEIDAYVLQAASASHSAATSVRVWGVPLEYIAQASNLNGQQFALYGGMGKGLPLANPAQSGLLVSGIIQQAFANWVGTLMTLDLVIMPGASTPTNVPAAVIASGPGAPANIVVNWQKGTPLATALQTTLRTAFPTYSLNVAISTTLVLDSTEVHFCGSLTQLAQYVNGLSRRLGGVNQNLGPWAPSFAISASGQYRGVQISSDGTTIYVTDGSGASPQTTNATTSTTSVGKSQDTPFQISYTDLVGQPTWIGPQQIQITTVMRADITSAMFVQLPPTRATVTAQALTGVGAIGTAASPWISNVSFQGVYQVMDIHHLGNYKDPSALAWVSVLNCGVATLGAGGTASTPIGSTPSGNVTFSDLTITPGS